MLQDLTRKFQSELIDIQQMIETIKELGIDTGKLEKLAKKIETNLLIGLEEIEASYDCNTSINDFFKEDYTRTVYEKHLSNLSQLRQKLIEEYNNYSKINGTCLYIQAHLKHTNHSNLLQYVIETKNLLKQLNETSLLDHTVKTKVMGQVYDVVYEIIKKEFVITKNSQILNYVKQNEVDIPYLEKCVLQELLTLDLTEEQNTELALKLKVIKKQGLETDYLDEELLLLLSYPRQYEEEVLKEEKEKLISLSEEIEDSKKILSQAIDKKTILTKELNRAKKDRNIQLFEFSKPAAVTAIYVSSFIAFSYGIWHFNKEYFKDIYYPTLEETYNITSCEELPPKTTEQTKKDEQAVIIEYGLWEEKTPSKYNYKFEREVRTYDVSEIDYEYLKDYATLDLLPLGIEPEITIDGKSSLTPTDLYTTEYKVVKRYTQDEENPIYQSDSTWIVVDILEEFMLILGYVMIQAELCDKTYVGIDYFIDEGLLLLKEIKKLAKKKKNLANHNRQLQQLLERCDNLIQNFENEYQNLPQPLKKDTKIKKLLKQVKTKITEENFDC